MSAPDLILHVGAPKCGSSALQTMLTRHPDLRDGAGRRLRYVALRMPEGKYTLIQGGMVKRLGRASAYGYVCWPNFGPQTDSAPILAALREVVESGQRGGWVPILSCEGWINHPQIFADALAQMRYPRVDVVGFLRAPVEWVNAAWWQWGIWTGYSLDVWLKRRLLFYGFADNLKAWAAIPGVRLHVRHSRPDVVQKFVSLYGCDLQMRVPGNASAPASLIGFLLRNRAYRTTPHDAQAEFVFQRWCVMEPDRPLWALAPRHIHLMRPVTRHNRELLWRILPDADRADLFADPRWTREEPYHEAIRSGVSQLHDPADLPALHAALAGGVASASAAAQVQMPGLPGPLRAGDPVEQWDPVLAGMFDHLLALDARLRRAPVLEAVRRTGRALLRGLPGGGRRNRL
ncbi:hypothetical protein [Roseovarius atlanticus]|uniref:hypothetical protein n=1 Tax=Roseovarius atlanticus TaxID=1641875 RepID=UPI001C94660F|nr:hypothetical protein [Roseovarius atlanticus]MBY6127076.1 hypothetical protein [Roseovarius atlanticus]MBY6151570.1 hypothetical protein [Roseovarius atlanticus]